MRARNFIFSRLILGLTLSFMLVACAVLPTPTPQATLAPSHTPAPSATPLTPSPSFTPAPTLTPTIAPTPEPTPIPALERVVLISFDGLGASSVNAETMPFLHAILAKSAWSLKASTTMPSVTLPSHTSMLTGLCTEHHNITWNDFQPDRGFAQAEDIFEVAHTAGLQTQMLVGKYKLWHISEPKNLSLFETLYHGDAQILTRATEVIKQDFDLLFIHLPGGDDTGHVYGWESQEHADGLRASDDLVHDFLSELEQTYGLSQTLVIFTADHGGHAHNHGSDLPEDMLIPWVAYGWAVTPGELQTPIITVDTTPTIAWAFGLPLSPSWDGSPVYEAFSRTDIPRQDTLCQWP